MVKVKICGITSQDDALAAVDAGADSLGLNFVGGPRQIERQQAEEIIKVLPACVPVTALVRLENGQLAKEQQAWLEQQAIRYLQIYGEFRYADLASLHGQGFTLWPVLTVGHASFEDNAALWFSAEGPRAMGAIVLDTSDSRLAGGTGRTFRWDWVTQARQDGRLAEWPPIILAGGLRPENVAEAIRTVEPYGVDVSSGVEKDGRPGFKDPARMQAFVRNARNAVEP
ncbi:MAG: phosphoribosylanthranilate isomerase [Phycisphaerales bacterium]|nr:phosphoribosylanthranilate isomerase [Phycisphaerales bacterium]